MARDAETGRIGTYQAQFVIPNLNKVLKRVPISSVVLSGQQVNVKDALYSTMKSKDAAKNDAANPLVQDGMKLIPSVTRVFAVDREFTVYLQAYVGSNVTPPATTPTASSAPPTPGPLIATLSFYRDQTKVTELPAVVSRPVPGTGLGIVPLRFGIAAGTLSPGRYECEVSVLDPTGQRASFWVGSIQMVR